jgi:hypothetical protein
VKIKDSGILSSVYFTGGSKANGLPALLKSKALPPDIGITISIFLLPKIKGFATLPTATLTSNQLLLLPFNRE